MASSRALRFSRAVDPVGTRAFLHAVDVLSTQGVDLALPLFAPASASTYVYLRAAANLRVGQALLANDNERAAEAYLRAVDCGPRAFGFLDDTGLAFPNPSGDPLSTAPNNLALFVSNFDLRPGTALFQRIHAWLRDDGPRSECPAWRAIALFYSGALAFTVDRDTKDAHARWAEAMRIPDAELGADTLGMQAKLLSAENLQRTDGSPSQPTSDALLRSLQRYHHGRVAYVSHVPVCATCGRHDSPLLACGRCGTARYCGVDCQRAAWSAHRTTCAPKAPP